ncbi:DASH family cryptochrome [Aequorivita capsosiphonis]|uniref:DASH family cryptochrome n=1 Tax=Aequorivita capsosiphonis TaxID=487317 RepID=UPI0003F97BDC|nr:DASH family cryptochrome [Aequorivita capsosiphonis]
MSDKLVSEHALVWFKNDLRLHDNEALFKAVASGLPLIFLYCVDIQLYQNISLGFPKADINRVIFLKQAVNNLQQNLNAKNAFLRIEVGLPEDILICYIEKYNITQIFAEQEYAWEELQLIDSLQNKVGVKVEFKFYWGKTLYHKDDIPFTIKEIPLTSKTYRIPTAKQTEVREPLPIPKKFNAANGFESNLFPAFEELGFSYQETQLVDPFVKGGEDEALKRLDYYTFESELLTKYRWTRNNSMGLDYSSKFSPYLSLGCISARTIYKIIQEYEKRVKKNQSTWWLIFEMVWRDYFTFKGMKLGNAIFQTKGFRNKKLQFENNPDFFKKWCNGITGIPFVDANMRQLNKTGYMSNRGRVNCASFLIHDLKIDWTWGAAYFESKLIDYDVSSNWMNWHMQAYEIWYTNPIYQGFKYKEKEFIQKWIPELKPISDNYIYIPWFESKEKPEIKGYPKPFEILQKWNWSINKILKSMEK